MIALVQLLKKNKVSDTNLIIQILYEPWASISKNLKNNIKMISDGLGTLRRMGRNFGKFWKK